MTDNKLSTDSYKGVRDFYPEDMAVQQYIFDTWAKTAESFGFERYDASILEPSALYKAKGAENEEMVNEQTYTFTDRGDREVTLRPEMTPTVARMVAGKRRELAFPLRWYSIPSLYRYERPQKGRLREHWQLNCDMFGSDDISADVEIIALAYQTMIDFGAKPEQFAIHINSRKVYADTLIAIMQKNDHIPSDSEILKIIRLGDKIKKVDLDTFNAELLLIVGDKSHNDIVRFLHDNDIGDLEIDSRDSLLKIHEELFNQKIKNVILDNKLARGFDYYTGTIFEIFELDSNGNSTGRSMLGGGRYDNLTSMFPGEPVSGIGFGMGDVTMRDFLETHNLIPDSVKNTGTRVVIIPMTAEQNISGQAIAQQIRQAGITVTTDIGTKKVEKKIISARNKGSEFIIVIGEDEVKSNELTLKNLSTNEEITGQISEIMG